MTKKDCIAIAETIKTAPVANDERFALAQHFADMLATQNPRFDRKRFLIAAVGGC